MIVVGAVGADHMRARTPHRLEDLGVEGLGAFGRGDPDDLAGVHAGAAAEGEVDEHRGVSLEDLLRRLVDLLRHLFIGGDYAHDSGSVSTARAGRFSRELRCTGIPRSMDLLSRRPRVAMLLSALVAGGTVAAIAASDSPRALWDALEGIEPAWLAIAFGFELLSYVGYVLAYRSTVLMGKHTHVSLMQTVRLVVAGFGPFVPLGGFSFDRRALRTIHRSRREAHRQVLALGVIEYLLLAPAACICALVLLLESDRASLVLTLPWVFG